MLDAAHIRPYAELGPHKLENGILLRKDLHSEIHIKPTHLAGFTRAETT